MNKSTNTDALGMREMQARAFAARDAQYLLVKAPPASGKSRALMFLALDKMLKQGVAKTIVAVPELERQMDAGLYEKAILNPPKISTALRGLHPDAESCFKDSYSLEFLGLQNPSARQKSFRREVA
jgi:hypothetical protein